MQLFHSLFTYDNITLSLAILGSLGTLAGAIRILIQNHKRIKITILAYRNDCNLHIFYLLLENQSNLPISINQIFLLSDKHRCRCILLPKVEIKVNSSRNNIITHSSEYRSEAFPVNLPGLSSHASFVLFEPHEPLQIDSSKAVTFEVHTNRGKASRIELSLAGVPDCYQMLM